MRKITPKKDDYMEVGPMSRKKKASRDIYPSFSIDLEHLPEAKKWKVGSNYTIEMKVKMTGLSQSRFQNNAEFEIREVETGEAEDDADEGDSEE